MTDIRHTPDVRAGAVADDQRVGYRHSASLLTGDVVALLAEVALAREEYREGRSKSVLERLGSLVHGL